jgi:creatinine amidohydrolase/Fe(II)-dependent formamide hydrolase-like protein
MRRVALFVLLALTLPAMALAQRPANAPPTAAAGKAPDTVFIEDLTWAEVRDMVKAGKTTVLVGTAGQEQKGPHMVDSEHHQVMDYTADKIARALGNTLVAPTITYVPEGSWDNPGGHMAKPGTITLPEDRFIELLVSTGRSLKSGGFTTIIFLGESGGNQNGMASASDKLNELWKGSARAFWIGDYYTKSHTDQENYIAEKLGIARDKIGGHANLMDTSELMFINPKGVRKNKFAAGGGYENSGVSGDPSKSTPELGKIFLQIKIDNSLAQIKKVLAAGAPPNYAQLAAAQRGARGGGERGAAAAAGERGGRGGRGGRGAAAEGGAAAATAKVEPSFMSAPAGISPTTPPDTTSLEELTWEEIRDLMKAGKTTVIIPTGGTEKNGYHMVLGKHNFVIAHNADLMARRLKNALVAPVVKWVPEGNPDSQCPGCLSLPSPAYDMLLDAAARSLKVSGFKDILLIGDSGGNQAGLTAVANKLNEEWKDSGVKVYALTDYYNQSRIYFRAWLEAQFGYDEQTSGSHAGITDTAQMMFIRPTGIRKDQIKPWGGPADSGVSGDPTKATPEIGKMGLEFKVNAGINQFKQLKNPPQRGGRGARGGR